MGSTGRKKGRFPATRWSLLGRAEASDEMARQQALGELLALYTPALRAFLVASRRVPDDQIDDLVQGFVADKILARKLLHHADRARGKFRSLLVKSLANYANSKSRTRQRREATVVTTDDLDQFASPEVRDHFDREWVQLVVRDALTMMEAGCREDDRMELWEIFSLRTVEPMLSGAEPVGYEDLTRRFQISTPRQVINLLTTAKRRFRKHLEDAVARYVQDDELVRQEIVALREIVAT